MIQTYKKGEKVQLSEHFNSSEFDCHCKNKTCTVTYIDTKLIDKLEEKRAKWRCPIKVISGFRCVAHNAKVGGKPGSEHLKGDAVDFDLETVAEKIGYDQMVQDVQDFDGLGIDKKRGFVHVDVRGYRSRWTY